MRAPTIHFAAALAAITLLGGGQLLAQSRASATTTFRTTVPPIVKVVEVPGAYGPDGAPVLAIRTNVPEIRAAVARGEFRPELVQAGAVALVRDGRRTVGGEAALAAHAEVQPAQYRLTVVAP